MREITKPEIDRCFEQAVTTLGGQLISDLLETKSPEFNNADFLFRKWNTVSELKVLQNDPDECDAIKKKEQALLQKWMDEERLSYFGNTIEIERLPKDMQWDLTALRSENVKRVMKKANKQIRDTKKKLKLPEAQGHIVIVNDGVPWLDAFSFPFAAYQATHGGDFSNINGISLVTVNFSTSLRNIPTKLKLWMDYVRSDLPPLNANFTQEFAKQFCHEIQTVSGELLPFHYRPDGFDLTQLAPYASR